MDISIIIVSYNTKDLTRRCIKEIQRHASPLTYEVFVVDNASIDGSADMIEKEFPWVKLIRLKKNIGFAAGNNAAIRMASGKYILLLNSDAFLDKDVLQHTISFMDEHPRIGILGCKLTNPDGSMQPCARMLPSPLNKLLSISGLAWRYPKSRFFGRVDYSWWDHNEVRSVGWVVGAYFLIRSETIKDIGILDERFFLYFEEIDYCKAAKRSGWEVVFYPFAQIIHIGGQSAANTGAQLSPKGRQLLSERIKSESRYYRKWYGISFVLISALIELLWNCIIFIKNSFNATNHASNKKKDALVTIGLILSILWKDRLGYINGKKIKTYYK